MVGNTGTDWFEGDSNWSERDNERDQQNGRARRPSTNKLAWGSRLLQPYGKGNTAGIVSFLIVVNTLAQLVFHQGIGLLPTGE
jgi:hypothetical protein